MKLQLNESLPTSYFKEVSIKFAQTQMCRYFILLTSVTDILFNSI